MALSWEEFPTLRLTITAFIIVCFNQLQAQLEVGDEYLLCRQCGHEVAKADDMVTMPSKMALAQRNDTILGVSDVLIQFFENPQGNRFEVITSRVADVFRDTQVIQGDTWFPGFSWSIIVCPRCGFHLGWWYVPPNHSQADSEHTFVGLILDHLLHKDYADSLLMTPKSYLR